MCVFCKEYFYFCQPTVAATLGSPSRTKRGLRRAARRGWPGLPIFNCAACSDRHHLRLMYAYLVIGTRPDDTVGIASPNETNPNNIGKGKCSWKTQNQISYRFEDVFSKESSLGSMNDRDILKQTSFNNHILQPECHTCVQNQCVQPSLEQEDQACDASDVSFDIHCEKISNTTFVRRFVTNYLSMVF